VPEETTDVSIVFAGEAGQGVRTIEELLLGLLPRTGLHVFSASEFMSRIRGGVNSTQLRVGPRPLRAAVERVDVLIPLVDELTKHLAGRLDDETVILAETERLSGYAEALDVSLQAVAEELGSKLYSNSVAVGLVAGLLGVDAEAAAGHVAEHFAAKGDEVAEANAEAVRRGHRRGRELVEDGSVAFELGRDETAGENLVLSGTEAVALGALAGGCNYCCAYPMSPSTGVLVELAARQDELPLVVEQVEDEIAAVNMAAGAAAAGARALVTTSGGGLALMSEGLSVVGNMELPLVLHVAQRPGPATGLPTRTEQGDLNLALHSGHGDFARIILAPGDWEQAFALSHSAFNLAATYQVPVFLLTDQYLVDSSVDLPAPALDGLRVEEHIIDTAADYRRYRLTENGVSPRGVYGRGAGLVRSDSHTHTEDGHISEDLVDIRPAMVEKQLRKLETIATAAEAPTLYGPEDYRDLLVCWGSVLPAVREALELAGDGRTALLHFSWLYPLPEAALEYLERAERIVVLEQNATGQFADLLLRDLGFPVDEKYLKFNGLQLTVEDIVELLEADAAADDD
jgi:2-oxoglutarate ferredoxin oxidoreductase subunit alpha